MDYANKIQTLGATNKNRTQRLKFTKKKFI